MEKQKITLKDFLRFVPAGLTALSFLAAHYFHNKWIGFHSDSPWEESFQFIGIIGYLKNILLIAWRLFDFGNVFVLLGIVIMLFRSKAKAKHFNFFASFLIGFGLVFVVPLAGFKYLTAHRYFMPIYLLFSFALVTWLIQQQAHKLGVLLLTLLFLGNWWIYPRTISQGWDVSLGHLPFYSLVDKMNQFVSESEINPEEIGTEFPIKSLSKYLYLDETSPQYQEARVGEERYIIYSRVINHYKVEDFHRLNQEYTLLKDFNHFFIDLKLYEKRTETETRGTQQN